MKMLRVIFLLVLTWTSASAEDYYRKGTFRRSHSGLTEVPDDIPYEAWKVDLTYNKITTLKSNMFGNLVNLCKILFIDNNDISVIEPDAFRGLVSLELLSLYNNALTTLKNNTFKWLTNCRVLDINDNDISDIEPDAFKGLVSLEKLYMKNNKLTLRNNTFKWLTNCKELIIQRNDISTIEPDAFKGLVSLNELDLYWNKLTTLRNNTFKWLKKCTILNMNTNYISTIEPDAFKGLDSLDTLHISYNGISTLEPDMFKGLVSLKRMDISYNNLTTLRSNTLKWLTNCTFLDIGDNDISVIEPDAFKGLVSLKRMDISYNNLTSLRSNTFLGLINCTYLGISDNDISTIEPDTFKGLESLEELDIESNTLTELRADMFIGLGSLEKLYLHNNRLTHLQSDVFINLPRPLSLAVDNRFQCDTDLCWLIQETLDGTITCDRDYYCSNCSQDCTNMGICSEPGGIKHAVRSGATWPYTTNSQVTYTCDPCFNGGGTITCQSNGTWTPRPECHSAAEIAVECPDPHPLSHGSYQPSTGPYTCGSTVTYTCDPCFTGGGTIICQRNGTWTPRQECHSAEAKCPDPQPPSHGSYEPFTGPYICGSVVTFTCNDGYKMAGNNYITCSSLGHWIGLAPSCDPSTAEPGKDTLMPVLVGVGSAVVAVLIAAVIVYICLKTHRGPESKGYMNPLVVANEDCERSIHM